MIQLSSETRALIPVFNEYGEPETLIYGVTEVNRVKGSPIELLEEACLYYGSSVQGRIEAAKGFLGPHRKTPVLMDWNADTVFFPTIAKESKECIWINFQHVLEVEPLKAGAKVYFTKGHSLELTVSKHTVLKQKQRSVELAFGMKKRFGVMAPIGH